MKRPIPFRIRRDDGPARRFLSEERGSLTMEFVLWVPILVFWLIFSLVVYDAYMTRNLASKAAYTISDIVSRKSVLDQSALEELYVLQSKLLPRAGADLGLRVSNIRCVVDPSAPADGCDHEVVWSVKRVPEGGIEGYEILTGGDDVPPGILPKMQDDEELLLVDLRVPFEPIAKWVGIDNREWEVRVVTRARYVAGLALGQDLVAGS